MAKEIDHVDALFDKTYLRWFHLEGTPALVKITGVRRHVEMVMPKGKKDKKTVLDLELVKGAAREIKPLVLNITNGHSIAAIHGVKPSGWIGKEVVLYQDETDMYDQDLKKMVTRECIRIRPKKKESST